MIYPPNCYNRECKHYLGVSKPDGTEMSERPYCAAYLDGIPEEIAYGSAKHLTVRSDQDNEIVFEKE